MKTRPHRLAVTCSCGKPAVSARSLCVECYDSYRARKYGGGNGKGKTRRVCLRCEQEFWSEGANNRICPGCRNMNQRHVSINGYY